MEASGVIAERLLGMRLVGMRFLVLVAACLIPTIKGDGQYFRVRPSNSSVLEGGEVTISCEVGNRVGTVQWVKDGFAYVIQQNGEIVGHPRLKLIGDQNAGIFNLKITDASLTDDGEYECQVGRYLRVKPIRASAHLIVTSPPQKVAISNHPKKQVIEVKVGESRRLECIVSAAKPAASIIWYRGNTQIKGGDTTIAAISIQGDKEKPGETKELLKYDTHGSITIMPTADDNGMDYTCEASHPAIPIDRPMRATITLSVFYPPGPPYIEGYTEGETVQRGQNVELACRSRGGNPQAEIVWYRNDEKVTAAHRRGPGVSENVYSFIARAEDDKARYRCEVSNIMSVQPMKVHVDLTVLFAPAGVTITGPTEAKADDQVLITCTTENSNPPADIKWTVDGHNFESNASKTELAPNGGWITSSNVTFSINRKSRSIVVICHASNAKLTENVVGTHTINVIYPPSKLTVTGYEEGTTIVAGTVLKLMCTATAGNPLATLTWYKNDRKVLGTVRQRNHAVSSELAILVNASDNNAHVRCEATNSATEIPLLNVLVLKVYFPPERVKINREPQDFHAGQEGRLICESSSSNPAAEMSWWKNGIPVPGTRNSTKPGLHGGYLSSVELTLDLTEDMNGEVYTCEAKNAELGRSSHDATTLDVLYKPIFSPLDPYELTGLEGEPFVISVSARGNPNTTEYTWTRDGLPLGSSGKRITAHGSTLNITRLDRHDAGTYICEALNKEGTTFYQLNLTVQYPAKIKRTSSSGIVYPPGIEAKLFCEVDGSPIGDEYVTWQKIGSNPELPGRYSTSFINRTSYLHIENPSQEDVGEYRCKVNNGIGNITSDPILFITNFKPEMTNTPLTRKAAANKGINVQLFCKARGSPLPHFTWIFNGKTLLPNATEDKYSITHSDLSELYSETTLTIYKVRSQDYGKYECLAQNKMGHSTENILLDVTSPPDKPSDLEVYNYTHDSVTLIWKRGFDGGLPTSHQIRWRQALDYDDRYHYLDVVPGEYKATISGLSLGTYYVFSVKAINEKGDSGFLPDLVKVQTLRPNNEENLPDVLSEKGDFPMNYIYTLAATSVIIFIVNVFIMSWYIIRKRNKTRINKSQTADMYAPSTVNGDTMTGELSSMSDEKSDVNFDANDYVDEGRKTAASTYLIDQTMQDFGKGGLEMQVHQGTLGRRSNHMQTSMNMDSPPQRTTASGTLSGTLSKSSYIGNPSPAPPNDVSFYSVEMDNGGRGYIGYDGNPSPAPPAIDPTGGPYYPSSMGSTGHIMGGHMTGASTGTLTRTRTLPRPVPPPDVTVMTAGTKSPIPPSVPPPPATFARAGTNNGGPHSHPHLHPPPPSCQSHPLSTFAATPSYSDIDGHLV
ncbi:PREDICTED: nephrin-like isoform X3 [Trachymyrmex septentrionalis]|uniref:nephrin-like isoform X3 n=1 Tax=Trachymyrmex septentrionalis TaxID=34720 RepID=UPI00084F644A|nr:PREDICTED: nephrin-like isoform X3 [Trachymyrmex septentrionalis]